MRTAVADDEPDRPVVPTPVWVNGQPYSPTTSATWLTTNFDSGGWLPSGLTVARNTTTLPESILPVRWTLS